MLDKTDDISVAADNWLVQFEDALASPDDVLLKPLFHPDSYWRDVLALSWNIQTVNRAFAIIEELPSHARRSDPRDFRIDAERAAPRRVMRAGTNAIEAIFKFETATGRGHGIVRLIPDAADGDGGFAPHFARDLHGADDGASVLTLGRRGRRRGRGQRRCRVL
ncbi:MAG: hypothetical protein ACK5DO_23555, partial [Bradyrhizobium sp.]